MPGLHCNHHAYRTPFLNTKSIYRIMANCEFNYRILILGPDVIKLFSTQLSLKLILLINVKILPIVGILTCISSINTNPDSLKVYRKKKIFFIISVELSMKKTLIVALTFYNFIIFTIKMKK